VDSVEITLSEDLGTPIGLPLILTDVLGGYTISGLPPGGYIVGFEPKSRDRLLAGSVPVTISASNEIADVILETGVLLSGFVRDTTGVGIFNIDLKVENKTTGEILNTPGDNTDSTGFYDVIVPVDELIVAWRAVDPFAEPWIPVEMRFDVLGDTIIDITMVTGVFVGGTVRDHMNSVVVNANLDFIDADTGVKLVTNGDVTDTLGMYQVQVPLATYNVRAKPAPIDGLQGVEILNVPVFAETTLDVSVVPGVRISGTVTDPSVVGVEGVDIDVRDSNGAKFYTAFSATGIGGLYQFVVPTGVLGITYEPATSTLLAPVDLPSVPVSADTTINVALAFGIEFSGTVSKTSGGPVPNVDIDLRTVPGNVSVPLVDDRTDEFGAFLVVTPPGTYDVHVEPPLASDLVALLKPSVSMLVNTVDAFAVEPGAHVYGYVGDSVRAPIPDVTVTVDDLVAAQPVFTPTDKSNTTGRYDVVVPLSTHRMTFRTDPLSSIVDSVIVDSFAVDGDRILNVTFGVSVATGIPQAPPASPTALNNVYPNPFNPTTTIRFVLTQSGPVDLSILSVTGARVRQLVSGIRPVGEHYIEWDGRTDLGSPVASGVYFVRLRAGDRVFTRRAVLLK
jgi:hypothetical protein